MPPRARSRCQLDTRVRCTPTTFATTEGPPNRLMMVCAGSIATIRSDSRYKIKADVANMETLACSGLRYALGMNEGALAKWAREALKQKGISQADLAREMTRKLGRSIDRAAVNKSLLVRTKPNKKRRKIAGDELLAIEEITGYPAPLARRPPAIPVSLVSWVSAGRLTQQAPVTPTDVLRQMMVAELPAGDWIALEVDGDSMNYVAPPGAIIVVNRADRDPINGKYYVFSTGEGETTFKLYLGGPRPRLQPQSRNADHETILVTDDMTVVGRVARVILDL